MESVTVTTGPEHGLVDLAPVLAAATRGDGAAWRELINRYGRRIYALAKSRCRDPHTAEEITQSVFTTLASKVGAGEYQEQGRFEAWLFRVAMNRIRDHVRRAKRRSGEAGDAGLSRVAVRQNDEGISDVIRLQLRAAMDELPDADREVIELRHLGGMSFKQIAEMLGEPVGTLLARHHRALRKLKGSIERREHMPNNAGRGPSDGRPADRAQT